jgi:hypothetical protein
VFTGPLNTLGLGDEPQLDARQHGVEGLVVPRQGAAVAVDVHHPLHDAAGQGRLGVHLDRRQLGLGHHVGHRVAVGALLP